MLFLCMGVIHINAAAQDIFITRNANISFYSTAPIEDIEAKTTQAVSAVNITSRDVYFKIPITSFKFPNGLMQEHFNEDYLESDKYPYAEFKGKIVDPIDLKKAGHYAVTIQGNLNIHNVTKSYTVKGDLTVDSSKISARSVFNVKLKDHHIKIPTIIMQHIAEVVKVTVVADYIPNAKSK